MPAHFGGNQRRAPHEPDERSEHQEEQAQQQEDVGECHDDALLAGEEESCFSAMFCASEPGIRAARLFSASTTGRRAQLIVVQAGQVQIDALSRTVLIPASPTAPPRLRVRLNSPDPFLSISGASVTSEMLVIGTIASIMPKPRRICGTNSCQKSQSLVR